jgi:hypothetical protein
MLETMDESSGNMLGFTLTGTMTKADYETLDPVVESIVNQYGNVNLLFDMENLRGEKPEAWSSDLNFGKNYKGKINKMAYVGTKAWIKAAAKVSTPFATEVKSFDTDDDAWDWLGS